MFQLMFSENEWKGPVGTLPGIRGTGRHHFVFSVCLGGADRVLYVSFIIITKQKPIADTQKIIRKESKHN